MKKPTKRDHERVERLQKLAFGAHQMQTFLDEVNGLPGRTLGDNSRAVLQFLVSALIERCDDTYNGMHVHVYGELSPQRVAQIENEARAQERASPSSRIEGDSAYIRDAVSGQGTGADWNCPAALSTGRCRKPLAKIENDTCTCVDGHESY
jgi:hypothetical protein